MTILSRLTLTDFRNYKTLTWQPGQRLAVVTGPNGSGKTNLLESISLLTPGRGLRGARIAELARKGGSGRWAVAARLEDSGGGFDLGTGTAGDGPADRREYRLDGATPRTQAEITGRVASIWLTPQMDFLFQESPSGRRRFLDRLVWALEPGHAREAAAYDTATASRNRLLAQGNADAAWLAGLEESMARHAVALTASRKNFVARVNAARLPEGGFPRARMVLVDTLAERLEAEPALAVETWLRGELAAQRAQDEAAGGASLGAHRADMRLVDAATGLPASQASTGQQKALLMGVILAHATLVGEARASPPILLLDEPAVHLDRERRAALFHALGGLTSQAIVTGTDAEVFAPLRGEAAFFRAGGGQVQPAAGLSDF
jgi:DNA replication and repair protein RecF